MKNIAEKIGCDLHGRDQLNSCRPAAQAAKFLPLQHEIREQKREGYAHPKHGFGNRITQFFQSDDTKDYADFEKNDGDGEAASHPLVV